MFLQFYDFYIFYVLYKNIKNVKYIYIYTSPRDYKVQTLASVQVCEFGQYYLCSLSQGL